MKRLTNAEVVLLAAIEEVLGSSNDSMRNFSNAVDMCLCENTPIPEPALIEIKEIRNLALELQCRLEKLKGGST